MKKKFSRALAAVKLWIGQTVEYCCQHPFQIAAWILFSLLVVGAIINLLLWIIGLMSQTVAAIGAFFDKHFVTLVTVGLGIWYLFFRKTGDKPPAVSTSTNEVIMKHAKQGRSALLDHIFLVVESLAEQTEIYSPKTKGELAYPDTKRCIHIEDDVAVFTVQLHYAGEIDPKEFSLKFKERFNDRMAQKLNSGELPGHPNPVFYDADNETHTAIQAIRCTPVKGQKCIRLEVIRVNQAAVALLDKLDRESAPEANGEAQLYDDEL